MRAFMAEDDAGTARRRAVGKRLKWRFSAPATMATACLMATISPPLAITVLSKATAVRGSRDSQLGSGHGSQKAPGMNRSLKFCKKGRGRPRREYSAADGDYASAIMSATSARKAAVSLFDMSHIIAPVLVNASLTSLNHLVGAEEERNTQVSPSAHGKPGCFLDPGAVKPP
jgi:hypothetical protein